MAPEKLIRVDESAIGSILARDVQDGTGAIVCSAGDRLGWRVVHRLRRDGVSTVHVKSEPVRGENRSVDERLSELDKKFARVENDAVMRALKDIIAMKIRGASCGGT